VVKLVIAAHIVGRGHRLNALAVFRTNQARNIGRKHSAALSPAIAVRDNIELGNRQIIQRYGGWFAVLRPDAGEAHLTLASVDLFPLQNRNFLTAMIEVFLLAME
jgi:hypothetical protein